MGKKTQDGEVLLDAVTRVSSYDGSRSIKLIRFAARKHDNYKRLKSLIDGRERLEIGKEDDGPPNSLAARSTKVNKWSNKMREIGDCAASYENRRLKGYIVHAK
ncbi:hypothetical protein K0M31_020165 [Melipona bicolor]|uniref:Uncharacterized protein n=1 Tax=Melipona bicolor TaxID=60889 RepID=A0AA40G1M1_9HYME|nr:hypothetical protein K0M31_020165 [Melipona bicolor]